MKNKQKGITLIALIVTIVVLLILAGITIGTLTGENGIIGNSKKAKEQTEIANEKEILEQATTEAMGKGKYGTISKENLKQALEKITGEGKVEIGETEKGFEVGFIESKRYYEIDENGNVGDYQIAVQDPYPGDIKKDANGNTLDGSEEHPFEINCIEDLVTFSIMTNGGNAELEIESNNFTDKYVVLNRTLNFESIFSYKDDTSTKYGDLNLDGQIEDIKTELTKTDDGCIGFTAIKDFQGIFDGKENTIKNIYQNTTYYGGLFSKAGNNMNIKNISIDGHIISTLSAGGIVGDGEQGATISNCKNYAIIEGVSAVGGICGDRFKGTILNCINYGKIISSNSSNYGVGGIIGNNSGVYNIYNCMNFGKIEYGGNKSTWYFGGTGGIIGLNRSSLNNMKNNINFGEILSTSYLGGICGMDLYYWEKEIEINVINSYFLAMNNLSGIGNMESTKIEAFNASNIQTIVNKLNSYIEQNSSDTIGWKKWKIGENNYPIFE